MEKSKFSNRKNAPPVRINKTLVKRSTSIILSILVLGLTVTATGCDGKQLSSETLINEKERLSATATYSNEDSVYSPSEESIAYDKDANVFYYDNMLIAYLSSEFSEEQATKLADSVGGIVVGKMSGSLNTLQIMVQSNDLKGLESLTDTLMKNENVFYASYDFPIPLSISAADNNPWDNLGAVIADKNHKDNPDGNDWWAEAIDCYTAWDLSDKYIPDDVYESETAWVTTEKDDLKNARVGVIDLGVGFHEDLTQTVRASSNYPGASIRDHGTAVAAIIAATNNTVGLRGVSDKSELICIDYGLITDELEAKQYVNLLSTGEYLEMIKSLIEYDVKVINYSCGLHFMSENGYAENSRNDAAWERLINLDKVKETAPEEWTYETYRGYIQTLSEQTGMECFALLAGLIGGGKEDFLMVQAAGNGLDNGGSEYNANEQGFVYEDHNGDAGCDAKYHGFFCGMTEETYNLLPEKTQKHIEDSGCSYDSLREHTMIVGAVKNSRDVYGNYQMCEFSNFGETVDICAPGSDIFTATSHNSYAIPKSDPKNGYESFSGTSYAAPMVSGAAALVWSFDPSLTAAEVKNTLVTNISSLAIGVGNGAGTEYPMLNVGDAATAVAPK